MYVMSNRPMTNDDVHTPNNPHPNPNPKPHNSINSLSTMSKLETLLARYPDALDVVSLLCPKYDAEANGGDRAFVESAVARVEVGLCLYLCVCLSVYIHDSTHTYTRTPCLPTHHTTTTTTNNNNDSTLSAGPSSKTLRGTAPSLCGRTRA